MKLFDIIKQTLTEVNSYLHISKTNLETSTTEALSYIRGWIKSLRDKGGKTIDYTFAKQSIGYFYLFGYESKLYLENKLPWYDSVPLILFIKIWKAKSPEGGNITYILGLNMHWILPSVKSKIVKKLIQSDPMGFFNERRINGMSYKKLKSILGTSLMKQCSYAIRVYRFDYIQMMGRGVKIMRIKNTDITKVLAFNPIIPIGCTKAESVRIIKKEIDKRGKYI